MEQRNGRQNRISNLLKVLISLLGVAVVLATKVEPDQVLSSLIGMNWPLFLVATLLLLSGVPVRAYRWGSLVWSLDIEASWRRLVLLWFVGSFFNLFLPTGLGGDAVKAYELSRDSRETALVISSVVVDRFLGLFVLFALALPALAVGYRLVGSTERALIAAVFFVSLVGIGLLLQRTWLEAWAKRLGVDRALGRIKILRELYGSLRLYGRTALLRAALASLIFDLILVLGNYLLGLAVGIHLPVWTYFVFIPIISALTMFPSVGGLGVREGGYKLLFGHLVDPNQALALGLAYLLTLVLTGLIGAMIYIVQGIRGVRR